MPLDQANWQINLLAADKTANAFRSVEQNMRRLDTSSKSTVSSMASQMVAAVTQMKQLAVAYGVVQTAQELWGRAMKAADLGEQAEQIGLTTDQLQAYRLVAAQSGVAADQMDAAMMKLARAMGTANEGSDEMIARFDKLGVKLLDGDKKLRKASDVMPEVARGLLSIGSETERTALMQELFGRSGARLTTILEQMAQGNDSLVAAAKRQNAIISGETIKAWDDLDDKLKVASQQFDTMLAKFGAPVATLALDALILKATVLSELGKKAAGAWQWMMNGGNSSPIEGTLDKLVQAQADFETLKNRGASEAVLADVQREIDAMEAALKAYNAAATLPPVVVNATKPGTSQPPGKGEAKKVKADVDELGKLLDKVQKEAEQAAQTFENQFGDGTMYAANAVKELNLVMLQSPLGQGTYDRAMQAIADKAADMERAYRGAAGGVDGFFAGIEQGMVDMERANSTFNIGKRAVNELSQAVTDLASGAEVDFGRMAQSFINMLIQMEMQAAASNVFNAITGKGSTSQGIFGGIFGGGGSELGGIFDGMFSSIFGSPFGFADGGRPPIGRASIVGERGPELFVPDGAGTIFNRDQIGAMGGGGTTVVVHQNNQFGSDVSRTEMARWAVEIEKRAAEGAKAAIINDRMRAGPIKSVFKK